MYGTTMIATTSATRTEIEQAFAAWMAERAPYVRGFVDAGVQLSDDGGTLVNWVRFTDRGAYETLADDPAQDAFFTARLAPLIDGEPRWIDGEWTEPLVAR
jgi:hypothetical protein